MQTILARRKCLSALALLAQAKRSKVKGPSVRKRISVEEANQAMTQAIGEVIERMKWSPRE